MQTEAGNRVGCNTQSEPGNSVACKSFAFKRARRGASGATSLASRRSAERREHSFYVARHAHAVPGFDDLAALVDDERAALHAHVFAAVIELFDPDAVRFDQLFF